MAYRYKSWCLIKFFYELFDVPQDEVKSMTRVYDTGIELLGFKPIASIKPYFFIKPANFLYPDEKSIQGKETYPLRSATISSTC